LKDSTLLANLDKLASPAPPAPKQYTGTLVPHVSDASQHTSLDSAIVKVYHGNKLTATGVTAITGSCTISGLQPGEYLVSFNRRSFAPFSLMQVKVSAAGFSYIEVPMTKIKAPFFFIGENYRIWEYAGIGLAVLFLFAYFVSLFFWRHKMPPMPRAAV
jgi:hypothetical protein